MHRSLTGPCSPIREPESKDSRLPVSGLSSPRGPFPRSDRETERPTNRPTPFARAFRAPPSSREKTKRRRGASGRLPSVPSPRSRDEDGWSAAPALPRPFLGPSSARHYSVFLSQRFVPRIRPLPFPSWRRAADNEIALTVFIPRFSPIRAYDYEPILDLLMCGLIKKANYNRESACLTTSRLYQI
jgi:hypothetical protein